MLKKALSAVMSAWYAAFCAGVCCASGSEIRSLSRVMASGYLEVSPVSVDWPVCRSLAALLQYEPC